MINPKVTRQFIERKRDSHSWMKKVPSAALNKELRRLGFRAANADDPDGEPLSHHQKVCILLGLAYPAFAFWLDMGTGKTRISLELLNYFYKQTKKLKGALILAPSESALFSWEKQIAYWQIDIPYITLSNSSSEDKWNELAEFEGGFILATFAGLVRMVTKLAVKKGRKKRGLKPNPKLIAKLAAMIQAIVPDEATKLGHHTSLSYRIVNKLAKTCHWRYELAGRPFGRDPTMLWSQLFIVDRGETLGDTLGIFRAAFFDEKMNYFGGREYKFRKEMRGELKRILRHRSITYGAEECIDLPKLVSIPVEIVLPKEAEHYYEQFVKKVRARNSTFIERKNAFIRMRQVSSGYVGFTDDETGERAEIAFATNPKLDRLIELVEDVPHDCKFVIAHEFTNSGRMIYNRLKDAGIKSEWLWGGTKDSRSLLDRFDNDKRVRGLILNHKLGAYALNLQVANYLFIYESPVPAIDREQLERRVRRQGQLKRVYQYDLICQGTVDARILAFHKQGGNLFKAIIRNPAEALAQAS